MDGREAANEKWERGGRLGRRVWLWYVTAGIVFSILRVALLMRLVERSAGIGWSRIDLFLMHCFLYPEYLLGAHSRLGEVSPWAAYYLVWGSLLTLTSFVMATPILLVGWLVRRRR